MVNKSLNLFYECATECVYLCPQEEKCTRLSNSERMLTKVSKNGAIVKARVCKGYYKAFKNI